MLDQLSEGGKLLTPVQIITLARILNPDVGDALTPPETITWELDIDERPHNALKYCNSTQNYRIVKWTFDRLFLISSIDLRGTWLSKTLELRMLQDFSM